MGAKSPSVIAITLVAAWLGWGFDVYLVGLAILPFAVETKDGKLD